MTRSSTAIENRRLPRIPPKNKKTLRESQRETLRGDYKSVGLSENSGKGQTRLLDPLGFGELPPAPVAMNAGRLWSLARGAVLRSSAAPWGAPGSSDSSWAMGLLGLK